MSYKTRYKSYIRYFYVIVAILFISIIAVFSTILDEKLEFVSTIINHNEKLDEDKDYFIIGEKAKIDNCELYVNSITKAQESESYKGRTEKEYLIIDITLKNLGEKNIDYTPFYFKLENETGEIKDVILNDINKHNGIKNGTLSPGHELNGTLVFEDSLRKENLFLVYKPDMLSHRFIKIKLR